MIIIRELGLQSYIETYEKMKDFTLSRDEQTIDEIWILQHPPVFTQGQAGKQEHIFHRGHIPIVQSDRGGQVTYHGPGQLVVYFLLDCRRNHLNIRQLVSGIEQLVIHTLSAFQIEGHLICGAPGVYVLNQKIASLGLRIKNHCSYHGLALNVEMDLKPFKDINPCGYQHLEMTQMIALNPQANFSAVTDAFKKCLMTIIHDQGIFKDKISSCHSPSKTS
jgi:lipoyl(octanoyl) transferase